MATRRNKSAELPPDLPPEKAHSILKAQLAKLGELRSLNYMEAQEKEDEWYNLTAKLVMRSFGSESPNYQNFRNGRSAGEYYMLPEGAGVPHELNQKNFEARQGAYGSALRSCISELEVDLPEETIKGAYEPGQEYEFYRDVSACLKLAQKEIFIIDPYLSTEIFDVYAGAIPRTVIFRLLSGNLPRDVGTLAQKYSSGGNLALRSSNSIHDRVLFADNRVWLVGQSLKDAAKKKPTYIVEHDEPLQRIIYEDIWKKASVII